MASDIVSDSSEPSQNNVDPDDTQPDESDLDGGGENATGKSSPEKNPKICGVCGDKALGNNFNAITCESCKAFFRRNALRTKEFICPFSNNCKVDAITRRFCQRCRLKKCFDIGMKKEWIMTDDEKKLKKQKIEQNRLKRTSLENSGRSGDDSDGPASKVQRSESCAASPEEETNKDGHLDNSKALKQPMGLHNPNKQSSRPKGGKDIRPNVISAIATVDSESSSLEEIPGQQSSTIGIEFSHPSSNYSTSQQIQNPQHLASPSSTVITQPWTDVPEDDSLSSNSSSETLNQSSPLMKYPPNKRQKLLNKDGSGSVDVSLDGNPTPLLSSLIQPGYSESSPDNSSSPPDHRIMDGDSNVSNGVGVIIKNDGVNINNTFPSSDSPVTMILPHSPASIKAYRDNDVSHMSDHHPQPQIHDNPPTTGMVPRYEPHDNHQEHYSSDGGSLNYPMGVQERKHGYIVSRIANYHRDRTQRSMIPLPPLNTMDSILSVAIAAEFNAFGMLGTNSSRELNKAELAKLNELLLASQALHAPVDAERDIKVSETSDPSLLNVINLTEIAIRRLIKMSKKISGFKNMCQEDQIALLKGGCTEMMILRSVVTYDPLKDSWEIPHSNPGQYNIHLGVLKEARGNLYEEHQRFVKSFRSEWRKDENIMIILCAITLFTPERHNVIHKDVVKLEQDSYYYLLKRYLESILNGCEAKSTYLQLIKKIAELRALNQSHVRVFLEMNPKEVEPLLIEIFDLK